MNGSMTPLAWIVATALSVEAPNVQGSTSPGVTAHRIQISAGFAHWFGSAFASPDGLSTPTITLGIRPGVWFLELRARYTFALVPISLGSGESGRVGFGSLALVANRELGHRGQTLNAFAGPLGALCHDSTGTRPGFGLVVGTEYLFDPGWAAGNKLGPFMQVHELFYVLPSSGGQLRRDAQVDLGVTITWF